MESSWEATKVIQVTDNSGLDEGENYKVSVPQIFWRWNQYDMLIKYGYEKENSRGIPKFLAQITGKIYHLLK